MKESAVKLAIVSPARWGRLLLDAISQSSSLECAAVFSRSEENREAIARTYGAKPYSSYQDLLADNAIEGVILPTPHFLHHSQALDALRAGKAVFVEKPMANTLDECREMQALAEERDLPLAVGLQHRWTGAALKIKSMIDQGELGDIATATAMLGATLVPQYKVGEDWELDPDKCPGGPMDNLAVHHVDLLQFLLGPVKRVSGQVSAGLSPTPVPSMAVATLEFDSGAIASLMTHQVSAYVSQISIYGTKGAVHHQRAGQELYWQEILDPATAKHRKPEIKPLTHEGPDVFTTALQAELEAFGQCIRKGSQPKVGAAEGISSLRVIRAIMESSETGRHVEV